MPVLCRTEGRPRAKLSPAWARRAATRMLDALGLSDAELSVVIVDEKTMRALNARHRDDDHATDVLAFPLWEGPHAEIARSERVLGDVVISADTAARQARARGASVEDEATLLLAHGLLHLLGLDHRDRIETRRMSARTDALRSAARRDAPRSAGRARPQAGRGSKRISPRGKK